MFRIIAIAFLLLGAAPLIYWGIQSTKDERIYPRKLWLGGIILAGVVLAIAGTNVLFYLYSEHLWFSQLGFASRFWIEVRYAAASAIAGFAVAFVFLFLNLRIAYRGSSRWANWALAGITFFPAFLLGYTFYVKWPEILMFLNRSATEQVDPVLGRPISFYLFVLPLALEVVAWALSLVVATIFACLFVWSYSQARFDSENMRSRLRAFARQGFFLGGLFFALLALQTYFRIPSLMYSQMGAVSGAGYVDAVVRIPVYRVVMVIYAVLGLLAFVACGHSKTAVTIFGVDYENPSADKHKLKRGAILLGSSFVVVFIATVLLPTAVQSLAVRPNEITMEDPYLKHNITYTQQAYGIDERIHEETYEVQGRVTSEAVAANRATLDNIRLWDWRALMSNLKEQQEIRLYYAFHDVDIDRYTFDGKYKQVMLGVREIEKSGLDPKSQTWVSRHLKYTHGYGLAMLPVHEVLPQGKPKLVIKNIPPRVQVDGIDVNRPEIYYGERTNDHVYVRTSEREFDYPSGDENVYTNYEGEGGVKMNSLFRRILYAWRFDGHRILFSSYFNDESRIMFRRNIRRRLKEVAPFLTLDQDPYPVLTEDGHIKYIQDAYTTSRFYPYSERYQGQIPQFRNVNYVRNSVKAVIDAYDGSMTLYAMTDDDPVLNVYRNAFPKLFKTVSEMTDDIRNHIRYPEDMLTAQAEMFSIYHMNDVRAFYQREDAWQFAEERYRANFQKVTPYYIMMRFPEEESHEFILMTPFTPKNKNVVNAWMSGRCDGESYGELTVYKFPKGIEVLGPRQIEARIDQNTEMSQAMTLWGQRGSEVIRGNLLAIPLFHQKQLHLLFAEPIFLQAENANLPEFKRIALIDQERVVWARDFEVALDRLLAERLEEEEVAERDGKERSRAVPLIRKALDHLQSYRELSGEGKHRKAGEALEKLRDALQELEAAESIARDEDGRR